jgi:Phospholipase_D-nuclease N-terminal
MPVLILADFTLGDLLLGILGFFFAILAIWLFIVIFADIFTRPDLSGWGKAGWVLLIFILPVIGILIYLIARPPEEEVAARGILRIRD